MPRTKKAKQKKVEHYEHRTKERLNNPPVGLVSARTDRDAQKKSYIYDPHIDPTLQWAGKAERTSFEVPTLSLHVHERIDPHTIIEAVRRGQEKGGDNEQLSLFHSSVENPPLREAIEFYRHKHGWSNRLIAGDNLVVMNSLLEKEGLAGQVQMIYIDPPYGIKYRSNFQPFVNKKNVPDSDKDEDLTQEPEMVKAFRDTWELGIHSYLTYLRDRLQLARELLGDSGSLFFQINSENCHLAASLLNEIFGADNFIANIVFRKKTMPLGGRFIETMHDHILFYAKNKSRLKYRQLFEENDVSQITSHGPYALYPDGSWSKIAPEEFKNPAHPGGTRYYRLFSLIAPSYSPQTDFAFKFKGKQYSPPSKGAWVVDKAKLERLVSLGRIQPEGSSLSYRLFYEDFPYKKVTNFWLETAISYEKIYVVQTTPSVVARCVQMATDPGDLVFDPTCGSGTTAYVAEQFGRRWITCDTSRVSIALAKQRLMTKLFDYYELAHPEEGVGSGFIYKTVPHIKMKLLANNEPPSQEILYDQPFIDKTRARVTGPFTVEAVPAPAVRSLSNSKEEKSADNSLARSDETVRQAQWREELLQSGVRAKTGKRLMFARVEPLVGTRWLQAEAETKEDKPQRTVISFGPTYAPLEQRQVELALEEASHLVPKPSLVVFASFQFDPEAAKDIDETNWQGVTLLKVQMNTDLLTDDLKKKRMSSDSFWLIGQPDATLIKIKKGKDAGKYQVEVSGFDYYNPRTGTVDSGGVKQIAMWMLDTDYDGRSLFPRQVFFPMAGEKDAWSRLAKNLKAEIDEKLIEAYRGTVSLPFQIGKEKRVAVKIVDDRGIESLKIIECEE